MRREFYASYTVRFDEADCSGVLKPASFVRYLQDIAMKDAEDSPMENRGYWIIKRTKITCTQPISVMTSLDLCTYALGFKRITAQRAYDAFLQGHPRQEPVISARSMWVYLNEQKRPTRMPENVSDIWLPDGPQPQIPDQPWNAAPEGEPDRWTYAVQFSDIDLMGHLNNAVYIDILDNAAWQASGTSGVTPVTTPMYMLEYEIEYLDSALLGDHLDILTWWSPLPTEGQPWTRYQQIKRYDTVLVQARSSWSLQR